MVSRFAVGVVWSERARVWLGVVEVFDVALVVVAGSLVSENLIRFVAPGSDAAVIEFPLEVGVSIDAETSYVRCGFGVRVPGYCIAIVVVLPVRACDKTGAGTGALPALCSCC